MIQDHPDWIPRDELSRPLILNSSTYGKLGILDPSQQGVLNYLEHVAKTVFSDWGYEGVKLDFSTFAFDGKRNRLAGGLTALQCKRRLREIFRRYLPPDGFFGWCLVAGTGHPLVGAGADYFRFAEDISAKTTGRRPSASHCRRQTQTYSCRSVPFSLISIQSAGAGISRKANGGVG